ncbi:putative DNA repair metallo-beta-lactamase [Lyophyllum shimeji]|uniref:DNA repair metallo-beta-lactamase n=1 Tax=Lyophyllum shimeji TaxID=47721 RepID=A0A9P3PV76_LYOSH|nr:putative DNA repair metallo-beta-lactamase [Lyophyllum shimeji]
MPPSKRKSQSTVTLHNFFDAGTRSAQKAKGKQKATSKVQCLKQNKPPSPEDIIVIDSDSDTVEVVQVIRSKRRRHLSLSSGEVEFVDNDTGPATGACPASTTARSPSRDLQVTSLPDGQNATISTLPEQPTSAKSSPATDSVYSNGESSAHPFRVHTSLLNANTSTIAAATTTPDVLPFGAPTLLLGSRNVPVVSNQGASSSRDALPAEDQYPCDGEPMTDLGLPVDLDDEWGMGDDETAFTRAPDEEEEAVEEMEVEASSISAAEDVRRCPSCDTSLNGLSHFELSRHVNDCLDSGRPPDKSSTSASPPVSKLIQSKTALPPPKVQGPIQLISCDGKTKGPRAGNAFSVLMSSHKENEAWKEASTVEDRDFRPTKSNGGRRKAPFYKVLQGMPIAVDAFRYGTIPGVNAYFLTHAHSDHYTNLASNWKSGPIYCSEGTANLIIHMLSVDRKWVHPLPMDTPTLIPNTGGVHVTLIEANHCPGSCLFFFEGLQTVNAGDSAFKSPFVGSNRTFRYLHCGDFRASPRHVLHPAIDGKGIDHVYLDTTYLDSKYTFPPQPLVISACAELARKLVAGEPVAQKAGSIDAWTTPSSGEHQTKSEKMLVVVGTYSIGKERIVKAIAHALQTKVYCDARKAAILRCQADAELDALLTSDPLDAGVHLVPLGFITSDKLKIYMERFKGKFTKAVGFRPTGWTYTQPTGTDQLPSISSIISRPHRDFTWASLRPARNSTPSLQLFPVPYSEHSSFFELTCFAMSFDWGKMIATVNVYSEISRGRMAKWVAKWEGERKKRGKDTVVPYRHVDYW